MSYDIIPLIIILVSFVVIVIIIGRRFSQIASIDLGSIAQERHQQVKNRIILERLNRHWQFLKSKLLIISKPLLDRLILALNRFYGKIIKLEEEYKKTFLAESPPVFDAGQEIENLFLEAQKLFKEGKLDEAEKIYIKIIGLDNKNVAAYQELGELYSEKREYKLAKETFQYLLKLLKVIPAVNGNGKDKLSRLAASYFDLGCVCQKLAQFKAALVNFKKALEIEPTNPKYLDQTLKICIMLEDKEQAQDLFQKFKEVNPENQKLPEFEEKIKNL